MDNFNSPAHDGRVEMENLPRSTKSFKPIDYHGIQFLVEAIPHPDPRWIRI